MSGRQSKKARWQMPKNLLKKSLADVATVFDLSGRVALITGASGLLGSAMASALAEAGGRVIVASRKIETARRIAASLGGVVRDRRPGHSHPESQPRRGVVAVLPGGARGGGDHPEAQLESAGAGHHLGLAAGDRLCGGPRTDRSEEPHV